MRERGLKYAENRTWIEHNGRSREGAWIEIEGGCIPGWDSIVAPVRERGLK